MWRTAFPLLLVLAACASSAPAPAGADAGAGEAVFDRSPEAEPGPYHRVLEAMYGRWEVLLFGPEDAEGVEPVQAVGTATIEPILGGRYLDWRVELQRAEGPVSGRGLLGYDPAGRAYELLWISDLTTALRITRGKGDPTARGIRFEYAERDAEGRLLRARSTLRFPDADSLVIEQAGLGTDGEWHALQRGEYRRAPAD